MTGARLIEEAEAVREFLEMQHQVMESTAFAQCRRRQCNTLSAKIGLADGKVSVKEATRIIEELQQTLWDEEEREFLAGQVGRATEGPTKGSNKRRSTQTCKTFPHYLTRSEKDQLQSDIHNLLKVKVLVERSLLMHLTLPSEPTMQHVIVSGIMLGLKAPRPIDKYNMLQEYKSELRTRLKQQQQGPAEWHVLFYPDTPAGLDSELYKHAYAAEPPSELMDADVKQEVQSYEVPLRKTSKLVRACASFTEQGGRGSGNQNAIGPNPMQLMMEFMQMVKGNKDDANLLENFQVFHNKHRKRAPLPLPGPAATSAETALAPMESDDATEVARDEVMPEEEAEETGDRSLFDFGLDEGALKTLDTLKGALSEREVQKKQAVKGEASAVAAKTPLNATARAKAKAQPKALPTAAPKAAAASAKAGAKAVAKSVGKPGPKRKVHPCPQPGEGTFFWQGGKVHRNDRSSCWRVFINKSDRCDRKIHWKGDEQGTFERALKMIEAGG